VKIHIFCESFCIEIDHFIIKTLEGRLEGLLDDLEDMQYDFAIQYFDLSKLDVRKTIKTVPEEVEKNTILEVHIPCLISKPIEYFCEEIPVTPEKFIEEIVSSAMNRIMEDIKEENYEFLGKYKKFSRVIKELNKIHEKNRELKEKNKRR